MQIKYREYDDVNDNYVDEVMDVEPLTRESFAKAADVIEAEGLIKGCFINNRETEGLGCGYCTVGALMKVSGVPTIMTKYGEASIEQFKGVSEWIITMEDLPVMQEFKKTVAKPQTFNSGMSAVYSWSDSNPPETVIKVLREFSEERD